MSKWERLEPDPKGGISQGEGRGGAGGRGWDWGAAGGSRVFSPLAPLAPSAALRPNVRGTSRLQCLLALLRALQEQAGEVGARGLLLGVHALLHSTYFRFWVP